MINGAHAIIYASDTEAARAFFREVLGLPHVDAGEGWLIFTSRRANWPCTRSTLPPLASSSCSNACDLN